MLTNKRQIKKYIDRVGADIAEILLPAAVYTNAITDEKAREVLIEVARLGSEAKCRLSIVFDRSPEAFDSLRAYHSARSAYYRQAYSQAIKEFEDKVSEVITPINNAVKNVKK